MLGTDYVGIATVISATAAAVVSVIVALRQGTTQAKVDAVHAEVKTSNGQTLGEIVEANDLRKQK